MLDAGLRVERGALTSIIEWMDGYRDVVIQDIYAACFLLYAGGEVRLTEVE